MISFIFFLSFSFIYGITHQAVFAQSAEQVSEEAAAKAAEREQAKTEKKRRDVAVALNYCRASFHRIRKYPSQIVMEEERQKILNNLNLNVIQDAEIIKLYSDVLEEIGQIKLSKKKRNSMTPSSKNHCVRK